MKLYEMLIGMGAILSIFPAGSAPQVKARVGSDRENLAKDWVAVGNDMRVGVARSIQTVTTR